MWFIDFYEEPQVRASLLRDLRHLDFLIRRRVKTESQRSDVLEVTNMKHLYAPARKGASCSNKHSKQVTIPSSQVTTASVH